MGLKNKRPLAILMGLALTPSLSFAQSSPNASTSGPVVVELFESQGCSSCPPSEHVMAELRRTFGSSVILLNFHVDYWDYLGWKDPFSDSTYTDRQKLYARAFQQDSIYTPEIVVQGDKGFLGSDTVQANREVRSRLNKPASLARMTLSKKDSKMVLVTVVRPPDVGGASLHVIAVVYEDAPAVHVLKGENSGTTLSGDSAVRRVLLLLKLSTSEFAATITPDSEWNLSRVRVAVLVSGHSPAVLFANSLPWPR